MKINCYIALHAATLACTNNPLADTYPNDHTVHTSHITISPKIVTLFTAW